MKKLNCILLVDDDKATNFLNRRLLRKMDAANHISIALNGVEGIEYLEKSTAGNPGFPHPELILLDINMPLVDGWEFLEKYAKFSGGYKKSTVIVMLTTSLRQNDQERIDHFKEVQGLIAKPLNEERIEELIAQYFSEEQTT